MCCGVHCTEPDKLCQGRPRKVAIVISPLSAYSALCENLSAIAYLVSDRTSLAIFSLFRVVDNFQERVLHRFQPDGHPILCAQGDEGQRLDDMTGQHTGKVALQDYGQDQA